MLVSRKAKNANVVLARIGLMMDLEKTSAV